MCPAGGGIFVAQDLVVRPDDPPHEGRIAQQCGEPPGKEGIARTDVRIERAQRQQIAHGADLHVDQEQQRHQQHNELNRIGGKLRRVRLDHLRKAGGEDRDHEGPEEALDRPGAPVLGDGGAVPLVTPRDAATCHEGAEVKASVPRLKQIAVEPDDIGHRQHHQREDRNAQHLHRKQVIPRPVPAPERIEGGEQRPGRPQADQFDHRDRHDLVQGALEAPVDTCGGPEVHLVDQHRPRRHRQRGEEHRGERGVRP